MGLRRRALALCALSLGALSGCARLEPDAEPEGPVEILRQGVPGLCNAVVDRAGAVAIEGQYLPRVIACENGNAGFEALKAQAVAARSYLYYVMNRRGRIGDSQRDQVYSCGRQPDARHYLAVSGTAGQVLRHRGVQVAAFFVAGALPSTDDCRGTGLDPTRTERYVTYNAGRAAGAVQQSPIGRGDAAANRGCHSQNGARCLAARGWRYDRILRYYYGDDIELVRAEAPCIDAVAALPDAEDLGVGSGWSILDSHLLSLALLTAMVAAIVARPLIMRKRRRRRRR